MCYILAKPTNKYGCVALKTRLGKELGTLKNTLESLVLGKHIQIVTISRPMAYREYAPYSFVDTKDELIDRVKAMTVMSLNYID